MFGQQDVNELRRLLESGAMSPDDVASIIPGGQNMLAQLLQPEQMPQPNYDIAPMQDNTMRVENGPDAGKVTSLNFRGPQGQPPAEQRIKVAGFSNDGIVSDLGETTGAVPELDYSRPGIQTAQGKGYYGKDGQVYVKKPDGSVTKVLQGYDRNASYLAAKRGFEMRRAEADIAHVNEATEASKQARTQKEGLPGFGVPQSMLERQFGKAPEGQRWTPDGTLEEIPGGSGKPLNEAQGKAAGMATRAQAAHEGLMALESEGVTTPSLIKMGVEGVPMIGGALGMAANSVFASKGQQKVEQFQRDFVNSVLRPESGASISASEFDNARKQYFAQPGDSPEVIAQKQQAREREIAALGVMAGSNGARVIAKQNVNNASIGDRARAIFDAKAAIAKGVPAAAIRKRLAEMGIAAEGL